MGCGNSSPSTNNNNSKESNSSADLVESTSKISEESLPEDDKWKNYGGVYVGFASDFNVPQLQIGTLKENNRDSPSLRRPLWGNGF